MVEMYRAVIEFSSRYYSLSTLQELDSLLLKARFFLLAACIHFLPLSQSPLCPPSFKCVGDGETHHRESTSEET